MTTNTHPELPPMPEPPTLPQSLLNTIGEYGMARTDRVSQIEVTHRWQLLIAGIKEYAAAHALLCRNAALGQRDVLIDLLQECVGPLEVSAALIESDDTEQMEELIDKIKKAIRNLKENGNG